MASTWGTNLYGVNSFGSDVNLIPVTGTSVSSSTGQVQAFPETGWGAKTWNSGANWGDLNDTTFGVSSLLATTALSSVGIETNTFVPVTGSSLTTTIGNEIPETLNNGWGIKGWGEFAYGLTGTTLLTGVEATTTTGNAGTVIDVAFDVTGSGVSTNIGNSASSIDANPLATGISLSANVGSITEITGDALVTPTSATATTSVGSTTIDPTFLVGEGWGRDTFGNLAWGVNYSILPNGLSAQILSGNEDAITDVTFDVTTTGLMSTGIGSVDIQIDADIFVNVTEHTITSNIGSLATTGDALVQPTNQEPNFEFTAQGNAALSTDQFKFGTASLELDGTDDYVETTTNLDLSSGDFTVDVWIRPNSVTGYKGIWQSGTSTTEQSYLLGNQVYWTVTPSTIITSSVTVNANEWTMLSYERQGNTHRIYKNGTLEDTATTANKQDNGPFSIGENGFGDFNGYIDEFRVSDVARYSGSSFTEPTQQFTFDTDTQFLLHFDGDDGSTNIISADDTAFVATSTIGDAIGGTVQEVPVTGSALSTLIGNEDTTGNSNVSVTGVSATYSAGQLKYIATYDATGSSASTAVGSVTVTGTAVISPSGIDLTVSTGSPTILAWAEVDTGTDVVWEDVDIAA